MDNSKRIIKKIIFIIISALVMVTLSKLFSKYVIVEQNAPFQALIGGASCALLSSILFDWYTNKKKKENVENQLKEAISDLQKIKAIIKR